MPHIHFEPGQHDHTASAFIVRTDKDVPRVLLHRHKKVGIIVQPGGHIELTETPWAALTHELAEETGYLPEQLKVLQPATSLKIQHIPGSVVHPIPVVHRTHGFEGMWEGHYHTDSAYALVTSSDPAREPGEGESTEFLWLSYEELANYPDDDIAASAKVIGAQILTHFLQEWVQVPYDTFGLTLETEQELGKI